MKIPPLKLLATFVTENDGFEHCFSFILVLNSAYQLLTKAVTKAWVK